MHKLHCSAYQFGCRGLNYETYKLNKSLKIVQSSGMQILMEEEWRNCAVNGRLGDIAMNDRFPQITLILR